MVGNYQFPYRFLWPFAKEGDNQPMCRVEWLCIKACWWWPIPWRLQWLQIHFSLSVHFMHFKMAYALYAL
jgi:hypothetical protein